MINMFYNIKQALIQIGRNKGMSLASFFAITAMLLILGVLFSISININLFTEVIKQDFDTVEIYLEDDITEDNSDRLIMTFSELEGVKDVRYRTKDEALVIMKERWGESGFLLDSIGENPLPNSILVDVEDLDTAETVVKTANSTKGVESTKYFKETVDKLTRVTRFLQITSLIIMAFLVLISIVVVSNTIKLTVFARAKEISIMKYVGATNWFIRWPFLIEGIIIGVVSSLAAAGLVYLIYSRVIDIIGYRVMTILSSPLVSAAYLSKNLIIIFLSLGISIGACGSIVSMRRFLDA
ncbi:MAG: permease-like cell division protein FtsX [Eubacterium sp.]|nr:permease-like cell division protein FtsX [Eubacterium sp.]